MSRGTFKVATLGGAALTTASPRTDRVGSCRQKAGTEHMRRTAQERPLDYVQLARQIGVGTLVARMDMDKQRRFFSYSF